MNVKATTPLLLFVAILALGSACSTTSKAKISRAEAEKIALARVPNGTIKEAELEKENARLVWSFDIGTPGSREMVEIHVDALTGEVVATAQESEAHEQAEKKSEKQK